MSLSCVITVKGHGRDKPQLGSLKNDQTRVVKDFIKGVDSYYRTVFNHVQSCPKCDPQEVLEAYLTDRNRPKFGGLTSAGLAKLALRYEKNFGNRVSQKTVREFLWRVGSVDRLTEFASRLEPEEVVSGVYLMFQRWVSEPSSFNETWVNSCVEASKNFQCPYAHIFESVFILRKNGVTVLPPERDELIKLATVAFVMDC